MNMPKPRRVYFDATPQKVGPPKKAPVVLGAMIATYGEPDPITEGGGRIFDTEGGCYFEYTDAQAYGDEDELFVWGTFLEKDVFAQFERLFHENDLEDLCESIDTSIEVWKQLCRGTLKQRAECVCDIAAFFGWDSIDDQPLELSPEELQLRWYSEFAEEGPIVNTQESISALTSELLIVLHAINSDRYWNLLAPLFPLVPSEPLQNPQSAWWGLHGQEALDKLLATMKEVSPPLFEFGVREGQYGFWKKE